MVKNAASMKKTLRRKN